MSEKQEICHVVIRSNLPTRASLVDVRPVKVFDDRADARSYRDRYNKRAKKFRYSVVSVKKG